MRLSSKAVATVCAFTFIGCGGRSTLPGGEEGASAPVVVCKADADCDNVNLCLPQRCGTRGVCESAAPVLCDDSNICSADSCDPGSGKCLHESLLTDRDGDGMVGVREGVARPIAEACALDCDDNSAAVRPGGLEICDGKDNDCNGSVDEGAAFLPSGNGLLPVSENQERAQASGLAFDGERYALTYAGKQESWKIQFQNMSIQGALAPPVPLTSVNADTFGGPLIWTGSTYAVAWEDARQDDNYEVYFNRLDRAGNKFAPDLRITTAEDFSLHPAIVSSEGEFVVAWDDRRPEAGAGPNAVGIYAQRVSAQGELVGGNVPLTSPDTPSEYPELARGTSSIGLVYTSLVGGAPILNFRWLSPDLSELGPVVDVGFSDVRAPSILWIGDRYLVFWEQFRDGPGDTIWGAALAEDGRVLVSPRPVTEFGTFTRSHAAVSLGDRALLFWSDFRFGNYELHTKMLSPELLPQTPEVRLTNTPTETISPHVTLGANGAIGVLFEDWLSGSRQVYFTELSCQAGAAP